MTVEMAKALTPKKIAVAMAILFLLITPLFNVNAQKKRPRPRPVQKKQTGPRKPSPADQGPARTEEDVLYETSLETGGLNNESSVKNIYLGEFSRVDVERDSTTFNSMYGGYLDSFATRCRAQLPANKVEMTRQQCATEEVTRNGWGTEIGRTCIEWVTVGRGLYADPDMYAVKERLDRQLAADSFGTVFRILTDKDAIGKTINMTADAASAITDMDGLIAANGCTNPALRWFQDNLRLYALSSPGNKLSARASRPGPGNQRPTAPAKVAEYKEKDLDRLVDDLVRQQSANWTLNRYVRGSISGLSIVSRDAQGRPSAVTAGYDYDGFSGRSSGRVKITFSEGVPECMFYWDFPSTCRAPARSIISAYTSGDYDK